jgi:glycosyltransferase involved in cell wall biosynthesis
VLLEVPSLVGTAVWLQVLGRRRSYGVEVLGDPNPLRGPTTAAVYPVRSAARACARAMQRWQCRRAAAAIYPTREYLQHEYPCPGPTAAVPAADLAPEWFQDVPPRAPSAHRLVGAGTLDDPAAGVNTLLFAMAQCRAAGLEMSLTWIGDGPMRASLEALAGQLGVAPRVTFTGRGPAARVREILDAADLFVLPSRAGGATGALFEALARGLPCIASKIGDVPEHVHQGALVEPGVAHKLARRLSRFVQDEKFRGMLADHSLAAREELRRSDPAARRRFVEDLCRRRQPAAPAAKARATWETAGR